MGRGVFRVFLDFFVIFRFAVVLDVVCSGFRTGGEVVFMDYKFLVSFLCDFVLVGFVLCLVCCLS